MKELGGKEEKVVARDKPNKHCNYSVKRSLVRAGMVVLRDCNRVARDDDVYVYARRWKVLAGTKKGKKIFKIAAKLGRKIFAVLKAGIAYDGDYEKTEAAAEQSRKRSRTSRRRQRYRKNWEARKMAERQVSVLVALLVDMGVSEETLHQLLALEGDGGE